MNAKGGGRFPAWVKTQKMKDIVLEGRRIGVILTAADFTEGGRLKKKAKDRLEAAHQGTPTVVPVPADNTSSQPENPKPSRRKKAETSTQGAVGREVYTVLVEDHSGSMSSKKEAALRGVRQHFEKMGQLDKEGFTNYTSRIEFEGFVKRATSWVRTYNAPVPTSYHVGGSTALNDALAQAISLMKSLVVRTGESEKQLNIVVFTDGEENASRQYRNDSVGIAKLRTLVEEALSQGITIAVQGSGETKRWATSLGIIESNISVEDVDTSQGVITAMDRRTTALEASTQSYFSTGKAVTVGFFAG